MVALFIYVAILFVKTCCWLKKKATLWHSRQLFKSLVSLIKYRKDFLKTFFTSFDILANLCKHKCFFTNFYEHARLSTTAAPLISLADERARHATTTAPLVYLADVAMCSVEHTLVKCGFVNKRIWLVPYTKYV